MTYRDFKMLLPTTDSLNTMNEKQFQKLVVEIAAYYGWHDVYHTAFSIRSSPGFPDLALFNTEHGGSCYLEVKVKKNRPTPAQVQWLTTIRMAGIHAYIVHPKTIHGIAFVLNGQAHPPQVGSGEPDVYIDHAAPLLVEDWTPWEWDEEE